jgi:hypothetical protein
MSREYQEKINQIDDYLLGKLSKEEIEKFEIFLFGSPELLEEVKMREQVINLIKNERMSLIADYQNAKSPSIKQFLKDLFQRPQPAWAYAGALAAIIVLVVMLPSLLQDKISPAFMVNESMEPYLGETRRSSGDLFEISIITPGMGEEFIGDIPIEWETKKDGQAYTGMLELKIMNNKENIIQTRQTTGKEKALINISQSGLYYWTLEYEGEMLYLGKFIVKESVD